jgi:aldehyde dehydrogenase (NAD+)
LRASTLNRLAPFIKKTFQVNTFSSTIMSESNQSISDTYSDLQKAVKSRKTHSLEWREAQLRAMGAMLDEHYDDFIDALNLDLGRSEFASQMSELAQLKASVKDTISMLKDYTKPSVKLSMLSMPLKVIPATGCVVPEPLGLVLIIAPWNYPILLALHPVVGVIAAGNAVLLKPSEISSASSNLMAKLIPKFLDQEAIRVIEGVWPKQLRFLLTNLITYFTLVRLLLEELYTKLLLSISHQLHWSSAERVQY